MNAKLMVILLMIVGHTLCAQQENKEVIVDTVQHSPVFFPLSSDDFVRISSTYGYRKHPVLNTTRMHNGVDLVASKGTPVRAVANGLIAQAKYDTSYGNRIVIRHLGKMKTLYAHLQSMAVTKGQKVMSGDIIGYVGETGLTTGPHLHYEIWIQNKKINPLALWKLIIRKRQIEKIES